MAKDYYNTLGVSKGTSKEEIKKAYKKLAKQYHTDLNKEAGAEEKYQLDKVDFSFWVVSSRAYSNINISTNSCQ